MVGCVTWEVHPSGSATTWLTILTEMIGVESTAL